MTREQWNIFKNNMIYIYLSAITFPHNGNCIFADLEGHYKVRLNKNYDIGKVLWL